MCKSKILFKISGSIAAYKSAIIISNLIQSGCEVQTVATNYALEFIGKATLEGLTGKPVYVDQYETGKMMSHINLVKWADLTILCPASANTINKFASGIADNLVTSLFLAHNFSKPYLIAPAMNTAMFNHPATQSAITKLESWGINVLPTAEGYLACGDIGKGKLLEPEKIIEHIKSSLNKVEKKKLKILITSGGTRESIDGVRFITNMSTGKTGAAIANYFIQNKHSITFLQSINSMSPQGEYQKELFSDFANLEQKLFQLLSSNEYDAVIHLAAVSDFTLDKITIDKKTVSAPLEEKISSQAGEVMFNLKPTYKLVDKIKSSSKNQKIILVAFKLTSKHKEDSMHDVQNLFQHSSANFVVLNSLYDRQTNDTQTDFIIYNSQEEIARALSADTLALSIENILLK